MDDLMVYGSAGHGQLVPRGEFPSGVFCVAEVPDSPGLKPHAHIREVRIQRHYYPGLLFEMYVTEGCLEQYERQLDEFVVLYAIMRGWGPSHGRRRLN